jgi:hypothetical protein
VGDLFVSESGEENMRRRTAEEKEADRQAKMEAARTKQLEKEVKRHGSMEAAEAARQRDAEAAEAKRLEDVAKERQKQKESFLKTPAGQARQAFERGDQVFQYSIDVQETKATVVSMAGAYTRSKETNAPTDVLNSVCHEGWELVNGSFVFLELGSESRDKFLASGQQVAVKGTIIGYYLFKRSEANKRDMQMPWETEQDEPPRAHAPHPVGAQISASDGHDLGTSS